MKYLFYVLSFLLLRCRIAQEMGWGRALEEGLLIGFYFDWLVSFLPIFIALLGQLMHPKLARPAWIFFSGLLWTTVAANALYFSFFGTKLHWWVIENHWSDIFLIHGSIGQLARSWPIVVSALCLILALVPKTPWLSQKRRVIVSPLLVLGGLLLVIGLQQLPYQHQSFVKESLLQSPYNVVNLRSAAYDHPFIAWISDLDQQNFQSYGGLSQLSLKSLSSEEQKNPGVRAAMYRDAFSKPTEAYQEKFPLHKSLEAAPHQRAQWLQALGLKGSQPINVVHLYIESLRAFEFLDENLGPAIFPRLREVVAKRALSFQQTYSSVALPGQTVRGIFTAHCSFLENLYGPSTVMTQSSIRIRCLPEVFKDNGYQTYWLASHLPSFHNKDHFERLHGTQHIVPREDYIAAKLLPKGDPFNLTDANHFSSVLKFLQGLSQTQQGPYFLHTINLGTHMPWTLQQSDRLPRWVRDRFASKQDKNYLGYLSRFRMLDEALADFVEAFLASPASNNTLLVVTGDHSVHLPPPLPLTALQQQEIDYRVPLFYFSKARTQGLKIQAPVHHMDLAPTSALIAGLKGPVTWMGRALWPAEQPGSPWLIDSVEGHFSYRIGPRACYTLPPSTSLSCWQVPRGEDPLLSKKLRRFEEDPQTSQDYRGVAEASLLLLLRNSILPF